MPPYPRSVALALAAFAALTTAVTAGQNIADVRVMERPGQGPMPRDVGPMPQGMPSETLTGTGAISGVVLSADANRPVRRATVRLSSLARGVSRTATTDDQGRFQLEKLAAGQYTLTASKPGYLDSVYGQRKPGSGRPGTPISIVDAQRVERLSLPIARGGVIAGSVMDDVGEPAFGVDVRLFKYEWQGGERTLRAVGSDRADDRGGFRIGALLPGDYVVMAGGQSGSGGDFIAMSTGPGRAVAGSIIGPPPMLGPPGTETGTDEAMGYATVFYPNSTSGRGAVAIALGVSEERGGVDLQLPLVQFGQIAGIVTSESGQPVSAEVRLLNADDPMPSLNMRTTLSGPDGQFSFRNVPPGRYRVEAHSGPRQTIFVDTSGGQTRVQMAFSRAAPAGGGGFPPPGGRMGPAFDNQEPPLWASAEVSVSGRDTQSIPLSLRRGMTVSGRVAFDGSGQQPDDLTSIRLVLNTSSRAEGLMQSATGQVNQDGSFSIPDVMPGSYRISVLGANGWRPKSFDVVGKDALDFLLDVQPDRAIANATLTLTTRVSSLTGSVRDAAGQPAVAFTIVVFPEDASYWTPQSRRIHGTRPATDGTFSLANLPAGRYRLAALEDLEDGQWFDPELLKQASTAAIPIAIGDGEKRTQDIRVGR